jgi:hypothetical protein
MSKSAGPIEGWEVCAVSQKTPSDSCPIVLLGPHQDCQAWGRVYPVPLDTPPPRQLVGLEQWPHSND